MTNTNVEVIKSGDEYSVRINGKLLTEFDDTTKPYLFSTERNAEQAGKQIAAHLAL